MDNFARVISRRKLGISQFWSRAAGGKIISSGNVGRPIGMMSAEERKRNLVRENCCVKNVRFNYCKQWSAMQTRPSCSCLDAMANSADFSYFFFPSPHFLFLNLIRDLCFGGENSVRLIIVRWSTVVAFSLTLCKEKKEGKNPRFYTNEYKTLF